MMGKMSNSDGKHDNWSEEEILTFIVRKVLTGKKILQSAMRIYNAI